MFIRFVVGHPDDNHRLLTGVVTESRLLQDEGLLSPEEEDRLEKIYDHLNSTIPVPPFGTKKIPEDAVSYFRDSAKDGIRAMRDLSDLLESHGKHVRVIKTDSPGKIVYEDAFQVTVLEWKVLSTPKKMKSR